MLIEADLKSDIFQVSEALFLLKVGYFSIKRNSAPVEAMYKIINFKDRAKLPVFKI